AATEQERTRAQFELDAATARRDEAETVLGYTVVRAPRAGVVIDRYIEVGGTVQPGQVVVRLFDRLQLIATVPESLRRHLEVGQEVEVFIDAVDRACAGRVAELVPLADAAARAFDVKVTGPCEGGVIPGMF